MSMNQLFVAALAAFTTLSTPVFAEDIIVKDAYVRSSTPSSPTGAAFMMLMNQGQADDRLIAVSSAVAARVELHTHTEDANGVMRMGEIEGGIALEAGASHMMKRGGDHVMFMGLKEPLEQGGEITVTLTFEKAGDVEVVVVVDHKRKVDHSGHSNNG